MEISKDDKEMIRAYAKYYMNKHRNLPNEYECSSLIENMNNGHRWLVEAYLTELYKEFTKSCKPMKISAEDKAVIKAYVKYYIKKHKKVPSEYACSYLIGSMDIDNRRVVLAYLEELCEELGLME